MSYTTDRQPQGRARSTANLLREGMIAELVAIDDYSYFISYTDNREVKEILHHIMEEEKRHYGMFLDALRKVDDEESAMQEKVKNEVKLSNRGREKLGIKNRPAKDDLLKFIRDAIKGELEAIILYDHMVNEICDEYVNKIINSITKEEKEHVEELTKALVLLDKDTYGPIGWDL